MDWQAAGDWQGGEPGRDLPLAELLAAFARGGALETALPSAALAAALERAAGPGSLFDGADTDALIGIARQWAALESWAAAGLLGALRAMMREDEAGASVLRRRTDLPGGWDDSLNYEIAAALAMGPVSAQHLAGLAWTLGMRLPGIGRLLADGTLTRSKARLVAQLFEPLDEDEAARAEALILGDLAGKTYPQVERLARRAALAVAPDVAERRRSNAERAARVTVFREEAGTAGLSGRDLPAVEALAGHANVVARARVYELSGVFPGESTSRLQAQAYLDLLGGVPAADRIAFAATESADPPEDPGPDDDDDDGSDQDWPGGDSGYGPGPDAGGRDGDPDADDRDGDPDGGDEPGPDPVDGLDHDNNGDGREPGEDDGRPGESDSLEPSAAPLAEVTVPLATLQGQAERAGDNRLLGPLDPALARQLAAAAARSPHTRWEIIVTDEHGYAIGHGIARPARGRPGRPQPPEPRPRPGPALSALPARVTITVAQTLLHRLGAPATQPRPGAPPGGLGEGAPQAGTPQAGTPRLGTPRLGTPRLGARRLGARRAGGSRPGAPSGDWELTAGKPGIWTLILPGGRELTVRFDVVPTHDCDHRYQSSAYQPGDRLRRLVQIRDHQCTFPTCSRPAHESDFEHAIPYDKGGKTDACNAGARSRRCHQVKQSPGWSVTQPTPGWHQWTTPTDRTYTQEPWRYDA